jgi:hypothetical protein
MRTQSDTRQILSSPTVATTARIHRTPNGTPANDQPPTMNTDQGVSRKTRPTKCPVMGGRMGHSSRDRGQVPQRADRLGGHEARSQQARPPTAGKVHWESSTSVLRPGHCLACLALTSIQIDGELVFSQSCWAWSWLSFGLVSGLAMSGKVMSMVSRLAPVSACTRSVRVVRARAAMVWSGGP